MRLTKHTGNAIRILGHLAAAPGARTKAGDIAAALDITHANAVKTLHALVKGGVVSAMRGRSGGVSLARPPEQIALGDIVRITESTWRHDNGQGDASADDEGEFRDVLDSARDAFIAILDQHSLADMLRGARTGEQAGGAGLSDVARPAGRQTRRRRAESRRAASASRRPGQGSARIP